MKSGRMLKISQKWFVRDLLRRFDMEECKPVSAPKEMRLKLEKGTEKNPYKELVGCLTYERVVADEVEHCGSFELL